MALEIVVNRARCIATKACVNAAEGVFAISGGVSTVIDASGASEGEIVVAAEACPVGAITVLRDGERLV